MGLTSSRDVRSPWSYPGARVAESIPSPAFRDAVWNASVVVETNCAGNVAAFTQPGSGSTYTTYKEFINRLKDVMTGVRGWSEDLRVEEGGGRVHGLASRWNSPSTLRIATSPDILVTLRYPNGGKGGWPFPEGAPGLVPLPPRSTDGA